MHNFDKSNSPIPPQTATVTKFLECEKCGGKTFNCRYVFGIIPKVLVGMPNDAYTAVQLFFCDKCGTPVKDLIPEGFPIEKFSSDDENEDGASRIITD